MMLREATGPPSGDPGSFSPPPSRGGWDGGGETAEALDASGMELEKRMEYRAAKHGVGHSCSSPGGPEAPASHTHHELGNRRCHQNHQPLLGGPRQSAQS